MQPDLSNPAVYNIVKQDLLTQGFSAADADKALSKRVAQTQAPLLLQKGAITSEQAITAMGGIGTPGITGLIGEQSSNKSEQQQARVDTLDLATNALDMLKTTKPVTGFIGAPAQEFLGKFGLADSNSLAFNAQIAQLKATIAKARAGTSFTPNEEKLLNKYAPTVGDSHQQLEVKLNGLIDFFGNKQETNSAKNAALGIQKKNDVVSPFGTTTVQASDGTAPTSPDNLQAMDEQTLLQKIAGKAAKIAPIAGGILGGIGGSVVGAGAGGVGAIPGGAIGTGIGVAAGTALGKSLEDIAGIQNQTPADQLKEATVDAGTAATLDFATAGLLHIASPIVKGILKPVSNILPDLGEKLALRAIRPSPSQQARFMQKTGQNLTDFVMEKGLFKNGTEQVDTLIKPLQDKYDQLAIKSGATISPENVIKQFTQQIDELKALPINDAQVLAKKLETEAKLFIDQFGGQPAIPTADIIGIRRKIDDLIPKTAFMQDPIKAGANKITRDIYKAAIDESTGGQTADIGTELSKLYNFRDIAQAQEGLGKGNLPVNLLRQIGLTGAGVAASGGVGFAASGGNPMMAVLFGLGVPALMNNPKVVSFLAKGLIEKGAKLGLDGVEAGAKTQISLEILRRLLTNVGAAQINLLGTQ